MAAGGSLAGKLGLLLHQNLSHSLAAATLTISDLKPIHAAIITSGLSTDHFTIPRLIAYCAVSNSGDLFSYGQCLFSATPNPSLFTFNSMIRGFSLSSDHLQSIHLYTRMLRIGISPDNFTFPFLIRSCSSSPSSFLGRGIHGHVLKLRFDSDIFVVNNLLSLYSGFKDMGDAQKVFDESPCTLDVVSWTTMITGHSNCGEMDRARWFFDRMPSRNLISWNAMIAGYARSGFAMHARRLFDEMPERDVMSWSSLVSGFSQRGLCNEALAVFDEMILNGFTPNEATLVSAASACAQLRDLDRGRRLHCYALDRELRKMSVILGTALVDMYGKCGSIEDAYKVFREMSARNVYSWNSMITGLALNGSGKQALTLFWKMKLAGLQPNAITFIGVLSACSHAGLVDEGEMLFDMMIRVYGIRPLEEHYGCMVDLLSRAGLLQEAVDFVANMPVEPHPGLWGALAGACRIHDNVELGVEVGKRLIELEPHHGGRYVLLSNLYAAARRWDDMEIVRSLLKERRVVKVPGNSAVEMKPLLLPDPVTVNDH
ncbi:Tetratricopeptide-like helical domain-containing protein [Dioscorea alata]|uniref:Tetratricopeptide-like helical domain-containing protein n=1 Tax=Dioscorea alata TaxID=55571 RepID=A0ACB7V6X4_DIOAL|nr:Tetratricopeptide-like helical domain-containing protein [Dioscorea alata]